MLFQRGHGPTHTKQAAEDGSSGVLIPPDTVPSNSQPQDITSVGPPKSIFSWRDVVFDIKIKEEPRRLLDHVTGWVKPGTLTALMGTSGAGKTTLLDVLAQRVSTGVITGDMFVNGKPLESSFQHRTGTAEFKLNLY